MFLWTTGRTFAGAKIGLIRARETWRRRYLLLLLARVAFHTRKFALLGMAAQSQAVPRLMNVMNVPEESSQKMERTDARRAHPVGPRMLARVSARYV